MFGAIHQRLKQYLIFSTHSRRQEQQPWSWNSEQNSIFFRKTTHYFQSMSNMFTIGNLVSFTCPVESHFSIFKYTLKAQKSQHFSFFKMSPFYEPFSLNPALLRWNLNTSQTKEQKRRSDWCEIRTLMRPSDWCEIHTLNDLISARNIPLSIC